MSIGEGGGDDDGFPGDSRLRQNHFRFLLERLEFLNRHGSFCCSPGVFRDRAPTFPPGTVSFE